MFLKDYITAVASRAKIDENGNDQTGSSVRPFLIRCINQAYKEIAQNFDWEFLKRNADLITVPNYTTGTVNIVNNSHVVTGVGTVWTAAMQGRYFRPQTGFNWYKIAYVDVPNQLLNLEMPMIEATATAQTYTIWKRFYYLKSEVDRVFDFGTWIRNGVLLEQSTRDIEDITPNIANTGQASFFSPFGVNPIESSYSAGQVTIPVNSNVLTGIGTAWLDNAEAGDIVNISTLYLRVKRVESDTRIILYNYSPSDFSTANNYTITKDNQVGFQFYYSADKQYIYPYTYFKRVFDMVNEANDKTEFPEKFDLAIIDGAVMHYFEYANDPRKNQKLRDYQGRIYDLKRMGYIVKPRFRKMSPYIASRTGYGINRVY